MRVRTTHKANEYITPNKWYEAEWNNDSKTSFFFTVEDVTNVYGLVKGCAHIDFKDWEVEDNGI